MNAPAVTLHVFCSAKGGVGKSTLSVACARLLAQSGRQCVLIDADLTGTSLADGLSLCAPIVERDDQGRLDFFARPTGKFMTREETIKARNSRKFQEWSGRPPAPPFFNDLLLQGERGAECTVEALWWKHEQDDGLRVLPSSPLTQDIAIALGWLREEPFEWLQRFMWLLQGMREQLPALSDVVIDLPPGLFGFAHETLALLSNLKLGKPFPSGFPDLRAEEWRGQPFIVTTEDRNDFILALEYYVAHKAKLPHLKIVLNRATEGRSAWFSGELVRHFGSGLRLEAIPLIRVDELKPLRELFVSGRLHMNEDIKQLRMQLLGGDDAHRP
jgi:hypothetical protein